MKAEKSEVNYSAGMAKSHCGKSFKDDNGYCEHFKGSKDSLSSPGICEVVAGQIDRVYWCKKFKAI